MSLSRGALIAVSAATVAACGGNQNMFNPHGPAARSIATLGWWLFAVCGAVYVLVLLTALWAVARRWQVSDDAPAKLQTLARSVTGATVITAIILIGFTVASVVAGRGLTSPSGPGAVTVDVIGHQWWWEFQYRDVTPSDFVTSPNELHVPVGVPVHLQASSRDVIHSFWVPSLHGKRDLIPGLSTETWIQADVAGIYRGQCAEFCGVQHARMAFVIVAEPMSAFLEWIAHQRMPAAEPAAGDARRGFDVFQRSTCITCHTIRGTRAGSRIGPELTHVGSRLMIGAGTLPNTRASLVEWVANPHSVKPGVRMPPTPLAAADRDAVVTYLRSLR
jgi:cytochrome c oxidase subunit 2